MANPFGLKAALLAKNAEHMVLIHFLIAPQIVGPSQTRRDNHGKL